MRVQDLLPLEGYLSGARPAHRRAGSPTPYLKQSPTVLGLPIGSLIGSASGPRGIQSSGTEAAMLRQLIDLIGNLHQYIRI